ncbi:MAG: HD domain-containing protein, partial [Candidatus Roizmanbacteria bacterium]|nr:HD domain-containing protein [Candidatus Roizmanbacteria bacterium]
MLTEWKGSLPDSAILDFEQHIDLDPSITSQWYSFHGKQKEKLGTDELDYLTDAFYTAYVGHTYYPKEPHKARRGTGEVFMTHPLAVAELADEYGLDTEIKTIALLHDVHEDTHVSLAFIAERFGQQVAESIDRLTKIRGLSPASDKAETRLRIFSGLLEDPRIVIVKLLDRLHNLRTIHGLQEPSARAIARETLEYFVPLADLVGMAPLRDELIERSFTVLDPTIIERAREKREEWVSNTIDSTRQVRHTLPDIADNLITSHFEMPTLDSFISSSESGEFTIVEPQATVEFIYDEEQARTVFDRINSTYKSPVITGSTAEEHQFTFTLADEQHAIRLIPKMKFQADYQSLTTLYRQDREIDTTEYLRNEILVIQKLESIRGLITQLRDRKITAEEFDDLLADQIKTIRLPHVRIITPKGEEVRLIRNTAVHEGAAFIHEQVFRSAQAARIGNKLISLNTPVTHDQRVEYVVHPRGCWTIEPYMLDYITGNRSRFILKEGLRQLVDTATLLRKVGDRYSVETIDTKQSSTPAIAPYYTVMERSK